MQAQTVTPAIFVSVLADYNAGRSHGAWIPCDQGEDTALDAIRNLMATSPTLRQEGRRRANGPSMTMQALMAFGSANMRRSTSFAPGPKPSRNTAQHLPPSATRQRF